MSKMTFKYFMEYEDGQMARMETTGNLRIPVNIFIDNAAALDNLAEGLCTIDICGVGSTSNIDIYPSEEAYRATSPKMDTISMILMGTFSIHQDDENFQQSPHIIFSGRVLAVEWDPTAAQNKPNCCILIETLEMVINLYVRYDSVIEAGYIVHGVAWLFGEIVMNVEG